METAAGLWGVVQLKMSPSAGCVIPVETPAKAKRAPKPVRLAPAEINEVSTTVRLVYIVSIHSQCSRLIFIISCLFFYHIVVFAVIMTLKILCVNSLITLDSPGSEL